MSPKLRFVARRLAIGLVTLNGGYAVFSTLTAPEPLPQLQGPLRVPVA